MPKIPGSESLGGPSVPRGTRPIISGADTGAGMVGRGIEKIGATVSAIGEEERQKEDALDLIKADNDLQEGLRATRREFETDPDYKTYGPRFDEKVAPVLDSAASKIRNPNTRAKFLERGKGQIISSRESVLHRGLGLEREHKEVEVENELSRAQGAYATTRDPVERKRILDGMLEKATLAERTGLIRPKKAEDYRDRFVDGTIALDIEERLYEDPEGVLRDLGLVPGGRKPAPVTTGSPLKIEPAGEHSIVHAGSGAKFRVSGTYADRFAGFIADLEAAGVEVKGDQSGGYAKRNIRGTNTPSRHSHGEAIDINWHENAEGKPGALAEKLGGDDKVRELARKHGLKWGADFKGRSRDDMHFEVDKDAVVRRDLAPPIEGPDQAPDVMPYGDPDAPPSPEDAANPTRSQYAMLSGKRRQVMITKARIALSNIYQQRLNSDIARIEEGGEEERDESGQTWFEKASRILQPNVLSKWKSKRDAAILTRDATAPLQFMSDDEFTQHFEKIGRDPRTGEDRKDVEFVAIRNARRAAENTWEKIQSERSKDPYSAAAEHPEAKRVVDALKHRAGNVVIGTAEVMPDIKGGDPSLPGIITEGMTPAELRSARKQIVEANLAVQERLGVREPRHISKEGAQRLMAIRKDASEEQFRDGLAAAAKRAGDEYGAEMGEKVFRDALVLTQTNAGRAKIDEYASEGSAALIAQKRAEARADVLTKHMFGRPVTDADMANLKRQDQWLRVIGMGPDFSGRGSGLNPGLPSVGQPYQSPIRETKQPNERQSQALLQMIGQNPAKAQQLREDFDAKFGDGAAMRVISKMMQGETDR